MNPCESRSVARVLQLAVRFVVPSLSRVIRQIPIGVTWLHSRLKKPDQGDAVLDVVRTLVSVREATGLQRSQRNRPAKRNKLVQVIVPSSIGTILQVALQYWRLFASTALTAVRGDGRFSH